MFYTWSGVFWAYLHSTAIKTALKVALYDFLDGPPAPLNSQLMEKVYHYNRTKQIYFSMGPSVKFVLAIKDSISKKMGGNFFHVKKTKLGGGGGSEGSLVKDHTFYVFLFFGTLP